MTGYLLCIFVTSLFSSAIGMLVGTLNERKVWQEFAREVMRRKKLLGLTDEEWDNSEDQQE